MKQHRNIIIIVAALQFGLGCSENGNANSEASTSAVNMAVLDSGFNFDSSASETPKRIEIYRNTDALTAARSSYALNVADVTTDFTGNQIVLVTMGTQSSGGYSITAQSIEDIGDYIQLNISSKEPGAGCMVTTALTHPYQLLEIGSRKDLIVVEQYALEPCDN